MEDELLCTICANLFIKPVTLACSHTFCQYCIETWKKKKSECPICRKKITSSARTLVLDNVIEKVVIFHILLCFISLLLFVDVRKCISRAKRSKKNNAGGKAKIRV